jgi:pimeloyl-ACP methyl ester carboxylesterase
LTGAFADLTGTLGFISKYLSYMIGKLLMYKFFGELATKIMLPSVSRKELLDYHKNVIKIDPDEVKKYRQILNSYSITSALKKITAPTLILYGAYESVFHRYGYMIHKKVKNSEIRVIPGVGHGWNGEDPDEFNRIVVEFLLRHNSS